MTHILLEAPAPLAPRYTLRGAAVTSPPPDPHWAGGVDLLTYPEPPAGGWAVCADDPDPKETADFPSRSAGSFAVVMGAQCTTRGNDLGSLRSRLVAAFQVYEDAIVEDQFWNGTIDSDIPHLTDAGAVVVGSSGERLVNGISLLEQALADAAQSGFLHMSVRLATYAVAKGLVDKDGSTLRTKLGTIVVPGTGYNGAAPEAESDAPTGQEWAYATTNVRLLRDAEPTVFPDTDREAVDRESNEATYYVERPYVVTWDGVVQTGVLIDPTA
jgi:hypothetical protein